MDKEKLIDKIKNLQGLNNDEKADLLGLLRSFKKYGLVWEEKLEEVEERLREEIPVLTEVKERAIISDSVDAPNHILIEGDNLEALTTLSYTHEGAIDVIYIDPPYNTGNKDFIYNDKFVDAEDEYRHSKWLSFMSKRLRIAKRLLSDKGVIFISIDDNEQAQLKLLCDEIFGADKFVGAIVWFKKRKGSFLSNKLVSLTEYILPYSLGNLSLFGGLPNNSESQPIIKRTNAKKVLSFSANLVRTKLKDGIYHKGLYGVGTSATELLNDFVVENGYITTPFKLEAPFTWSQQMLNDEILKGTEIIINTMNLQVRVIRHNNDSIKAMPSFIDGREENATNEDAYELLKQVFNTDRPFMYSKPCNLVKKIVLSASYYNKSAIILDFFAGSGTTLHATMQLNAEDGGNRKCILVTNNENGICENVTYLRNKKVIEGYTTPKGEEVAGLTNNTLRYYRTEFLPRERSPRNMRALVSLATDLLCIKEDLYTEQKMFGKYPTHPKLMRYFANDKKKMLILYKEEAVSYIVEEIKNMEFNGKLKIYIFTPGRYPFSDDFFEVKDKVELVALPAAIYDAYTRVLPKRKEKYLIPEKEGEATPQTLFNDNEEGEE